MGLMEGSAKDQGHPAWEQRCWEACAAVEEYAWLQAEPVAAVAEPVVGVGVATGCRMNLTAEVAVLAGCAVGIAAGDGQTWEAHHG